MMPDVWRRSLRFPGVRLKPLPPIQKDFSGVKPQHLRHPSNAIEGCAIRAIWWAMSA
jgi:hypothetical protein